MSDENDKQLMAQIISDSARAEDLVELTDDPALKGLIVMVAESLSVQVYFFSRIKQLLADSQQRQAYQPRRPPVVIKPGESGKEQGL